LVLGGHSSFPGRLASTQCEEKPSFQDFVPGADWLEGERVEKKDEEFLKAFRYERGRALLFKKIRRVRFVLMEDF